MIRKIFFLGLFCILVLKFTEASIACRMYGVISDDLPDDLLQDHLINEPNSLYYLVQSTNIDGWGISYCPDYGDLAEIERGADTAFNDHTYYLIVEQINTSEPKITIAHIRNCSSGCCDHGHYTIADPHPFYRYKNEKWWTFAHNGGVSKTRLYGLIGDDYLYANGPFGSGIWTCSTDNPYADVVVDSELYFLLILKQIEDNGWNEVNGIVEAIRELRDAGETGALNFIMSDGFTLWAFRRGHTLDYLYDSDPLNGYSAVASQYPSSTRGDWIAVTDYKLIILTGDAEPVSIDVLNYTTPTPTPSTTPTQTPSITPTPTPLVTPTPSVSPAPSVTPTATPSTIPTVSPPPTISPSPTPEYLVLESGDYNGDGTSDIAIFRPETGLWAVRGVTRAYFGSTFDLPVSGDYDGNGTTEVGVFRRSSGLWGIKNVTRIYFGSFSDIAVPGDYDGDGCCEAGIFRESSGLWAIRNLTRTYFGTIDDRPVPGDYDGDGNKDIGLFRGSSGLWALKNISRIYFGSSSDKIVPGDYDGGGTWKAGVFRPSSGRWAIRGLTRMYFGSVSDQPVPADYDGNSTDDVGVFREDLGLWAVKGITRIYYGTLGDLPVTR